MGGVGLLWLWNRTQETSKTMKETEPPKEMCGINYLKGEIKNSEFLYSGEKLRLMNARVIKIHVQSSNGKKVDRKIYTLCDEDEIFSGKLKNGWVDTNGTLAHNATIWTQSKAKEVLKYTIYYNPLIPHQHSSE